MSTKRKRASQVSDGNAGEIDYALLEALEKDGAEVEQLDLRSLKKMVLSFERKLRDNFEARMKYSDQPERFVESEVDLDEELKKLQALAASPDLYPEIVRLDVVSNVLGLLSHENTDLSTDAVHLLNELTDADAIGDSNDAAVVLVDEMIKRNALELLVQNLSRLDESDPDEAAAVFNTLSILENVIEVKPGVAEHVCGKTPLMDWLLTRIRVKVFDANKLYASEILAILLQSSAENQQRLGNQDGVDALLQCVAQYKAKDPSTGDEEEMLENLYDCLCSVVMHPENKQKFVKAEGVELMIIVMKQKKQAYASALKALDFSMTRFRPACERFVDVLGLKSIFPAFMGKIPKSKSRNDRSTEEIEERLISLVHSLFAGLASEDPRKERLLSKFQENEFEKIDRLMEFFLRYLERVRIESKRLEQESIEDVELDDDDKYLKKLDAGLFTLQLIAMILGNLWTSELPGVQERIDLQLKQQRLSRADIKALLQEYHDNIGDVDGSEERDERKLKVQNLISLM